VDYRVCREMQVSAGMKELRQRLIETWTEFQQSIVNEAIGEAQQTLYLHSHNNYTHVRTLAVT